jgi:hypothetical protein
MSLDRQYLLAKTIDFDLGLDTLLEFACEPNEPVQYVVYSPRKSREEFREIIAHLTDNLVGQR